MAFSNQILYLFYTVRPNAPNTAPYTSLTIRSFTALQSVVWKVDRKTPAAAGFSAAAADST